MTSFQIQTFLEDLLSELTIDRVLPKYIFILARGYQQITEGLSELIYTKNRTVFSKKQQSSQDKFYEIRKQADTFPMGQIFHEAIEIQHTLDRLRSFFDGIEDRALTELYFQCERFYNAFELFARSSDDKTFAGLLLEANQIYPNLVMIRHVFSTFQQVLAQDKEMQPELNQLSLFFQQTKVYGTIVDKLASLERAYLEVCSLGDILAETFPLQVIKIETAAHDSGGLWICVRGEKRVIDVLGTLVGRFANFLFRRLSTGNNEVPISDRVLATQSLVNLTDELERGGFSNILDDEARLQKSALLIRRELVTLLAGEPVVKINGEQFQVDQPDRPNYITQSLRLLPQCNSAVQLNE